MTCSDYCGNHNHKPCVEYIPCFGPVGPAGPTATNQFLSLGSLAGTSTLLTTRTPINFTTVNASNGTHITATTPTTTVTLTALHSYYISYTVNATTTASSSLTATLLLGGNPVNSNTASNISGSVVSVSGGTIVTVGSSDKTLQLATTASVAAVMTLANADLSIIELL
ncbi:hypothetical protein GCM10008904_32850 [Paraclostridium ghonii]|uniref:BclA C-terminal domain-containing protein n=1 Tax=Paraclostridium ghonii TaxID=29358 RepID=A0ABU0N492_9FIRM|nr:hypothetical protein [Paeniclostridium ghonii]MDQ0557987.1 hypothetical protein [Paeniclostridium ghonii]